MLGWCPHCDAPRPGCIAIYRNGCRFTPDSEHAECGHRWPWGPVFYPELRRGRAVYLSRAWNAKTREPQKRPATTSACYLRLAAELLSQLLDVGKKGGDVLSSMGNEIDIPLVRPAIRVYVRPRMTPATACFQSSCTWIPAGVLATVVMSFVLVTRATCPRPRCSGASTRALTSSNSSSVNRITVRGPVKPDKLHRPQIVSAGDRGVARRTAAFGRAVPCDARCPGGARDVASARSSTTPNRLPTNGTDRLPSAPAEDSRSPGPRTQG